MEKIDKKIIEIFNDLNFEEYKKEQTELLDKWQYVESASISPKDRFELDKEAYIENYHKGAYRNYRDYDNNDEKILINRLIKNLESAQHPVWVEYRIYLKTLIKTDALPPQKDYKNNHWFKVGLLFANGKMNNLLDNHNRNATQIAIYLGNKNYRPYISETYSNTNKTDKNIYSSSTKLLTIIQYCESKNIDIIPEFIENYNLIKDK